MTEQFDKWIGAGSGSPNNGPSPEFQQWLGVPNAPLKPGQLPKWAAPDESTISHEIGLGAEALQRGAARVLGLPGDVEAIGRWAVSPWETPNGKFKVPEFTDKNNLLPTSNQLIGSKADQQGNYQPRNLLERGVAAAIEEAPVGILTGRALGQSLPEAAFSTLGSIAGEQTGKALLPESQWAPLLGSTIGGATSGQALASRKMANLKGSLGSDAEEAMSGTGQVAQNQMRKWLQSDTQEGRDAFRASGAAPANLPQKETKAWDSFRGAFPQGSDPIVIPDNYQGMLSDILSGKGQWSGKAISRDMPDIVGWKNDSDNITAQARKFGANPTMDLEDALKLRSQIGDKLNDPKVANVPASQQAIKAVYGALTEDIRATAQAHGVLPEFEAANAASVEKNQFKEAKIDPYVSGVKRSPADEPSPEEVGGTLIRNLKKGATEFNALNAELPEAGKSVREQMLKDVVKNPKLWSKMEEDSKSAIIPDEKTRDLMGRIVADTSGSHQRNLLQALVLSELGEAGGMGVNALLGSHIGGFAASVAGRAVGAMTPGLIRKGAGVLQTPEMWQGAGVGAMASPENPLYGPKAKPAIGGSTP